MDDNVGKFRNEILFLLLIDGGSHILMNELQELPKMPRELIERLKCFLVTFVSRLDSKPTVSSKMYR